MDLQGGNMYIYKITNIKDNKVYVGQTNDPKRRWSSHRRGQDPDMVIARAIKKHGVEAFRFEIIEKVSTREEANEREVYWIRELNSRVPEGYNVAEGGGFVPSPPRFGADNGRAKLSQEEAQYVLDHRDIPCYVLYIPFQDRITRQAFNEIYYGRTYKNLSTDTPMYPHNFEFSCQFRSNGLAYEQILRMRQEYADGVNWKDAYEEYKDVYTHPMSFYNAYTGRSYKYIMPEVFSEDNKKKQSRGQNVGARNPRSKLTETDVLKIRKDWIEGKTRQELYAEYPQVTPATVRDIINKKTWKHLL